MKNIRLKYKFIILMIGIVIISLMVKVFWTYEVQIDQAEKEMVEKASILTTQMDLVWDFISNNQNRINYNSDGTYDFKGLHCALVGRSIGIFLAEETDYEFRYVRENPRNKADLPDEFELQMLRKFEVDDSLRELWEITTFEDRTVLRYVTPMHLTKNCLDCHGEPAGEIDVTGYPKEGMQEGDLIGLSSVIVPTDLYMQDVKENIIKEIIFFILLLITIIIIIYIAVAKLIANPLIKLEEAIIQLKQGNFDVQLDEVASEGEMKDIAEHFSIMAKELEGLYNNLEKKVYLRTEELAIANKVLEEQWKQLEVINARLKEENQYKSDFLAIMSHELRTPLTSVMAFTEILETSQSLGEQEHAKILSEIHKNSQQLLHLINNILEMAKLDAGKSGLLLEMVDLVDVVNSVESVIEPLAQNKQINFESIIELDVPLIAGDWEKLRSVIENLASNAIKFTPSNGSVILSVEVKDNWIVVQVEDNGIGIKEQDKQYIFEKFSQSDTSVSRKYNGTGLGLALAKELTEMHGGFISVESTLGEGSIFTVRLPIKTIEG